MPYKTEKPAKAESIGVDDDKIAETLITRATAARSNRNSNFVNDWKKNIDSRLGKHTVNVAAGVMVDAGESQTEVNPDWALTKTKTANLFSLVPTIRATHENSDYAKAVPIFAKALNYEIGAKRSNLAAPMEEAANDVVNASGVAAILVEYMARFDEVEVPAVGQIDTGQGPIPIQQVPPELLQQLIDAKQIPTKTVPRTADYRFSATRLSPGNLIWPADFAGSDFDDADFIGHDGEKDSASAQLEFKLTDGQLEDALSGGNEENTSDLRSQKNHNREGTQKVKYTELFYWRYRVDPNEKSFSAIWRLVKLAGVDSPVLHEPWKGQRYNKKTRKYAGVCKFPIRVGTVTYISDHPVPPSDTEAGRPQTYDMRRSRSQMFMNRERSIPMRWFDVNRIDPMLQEQIMRGNWQAAIPTNGDGSRSMGEVARASYPGEDLSFDNMVKTDLMESWQLGPNQMGSAGRSGQTAAESGIVQDNFATNIGKERGKMSALFLGVVDVIAGLMTLYSDFPSLSKQEKQILSQSWNLEEVLPEIVLTIRPDSTIVLDSEQRLQKLVRFLNLTGKSGYVKVAPVIAEIAELSGVDPYEVMTQPSDRPETPNLSWRFSGKDDMMNPAVVAILSSQGVLPKPEDLQAAQQFLLAAQQVPQPPQPPPGSPAGQPGVAGAPEPPAPPPPGAGGGGAGPVGEAHPNWNLMPKIAARSEETE